MRRPYVSWFTWIIPARTRGMPAPDARSINLAVAPLARPMDAGDTGDNPRHHARRDNHDVALRDCKGERQTGAVPPVRRQRRVPA